MTTETIPVPDLGGAEDVEIIEVCVAVGDRIEAEDSLVVVESDKASMEIPSPRAGKITEIKLAVGDKINSGDAIAVIEPDSGQAEGEAADQGAEKDKDTEKDTDGTEKDTEKDTEKGAEKGSEQDGKRKSAATKSGETSDEPASDQGKSDAAASGSDAAAEETVETITVPDLGGPEEVDVIEVSVKAGDEVAEGDALIVLESDKASMDVPSPKAGTVQSLHVAEGDKVGSGAAIAELRVSAAGSGTARAQPEAPSQTRAEEDSSDAAAPTSSAERRPETKTPTSSGVTRPSAEVYAGPAVRKLGREMGIDLAKVPGSGPKGRILKEDVQEFVKSLVEGRGAISAAGIPAVPEVDFSKFGEVDTQSLSKMHKLTAANMQRSWLNVPHVTQFDDADITELEAFRKSLKREAEARDSKMTLLPFLLKACAAALKAHPKFNASLSSDGESMVFKQYVHIGVAVDTEAGLMVPVLRDVDRKSLWELAGESMELAEKARNRKLSPSDMQGGCFSISSLGAIGGQGFTPVVNAPEVAILGVSKLSVKPVWDGTAFVPREMLPLCLSYDHRAVNGADAGRFMTDLVGLLGDIRRLLL